MKNKNQLRKNGFTLMELLLVIAIIGILSGVLYAGLGNQRDRARKAAAIETVRSAMPYFVECYMKRQTIIVPASNGGNSICNLGINYPSLGTTGWTYTNSTDPIRIQKGTETVTCDYKNGANCQ